MVVLRRGRPALPELPPGRKVAVAAVLRRGRRRPRNGPGLGLRLELEEGLLGGVRHDRRLPVELLLGQLLDDGPGGGLGAEGDAAESLALPVDAVLVELDLEEVVDARRLHGVLDVLVGRPPGEVADVYLQRVQQSHFGCRLAFRHFDLQIEEQIGAQMRRTIIPHLKPILITSKLKIEIQINIKWSVNSCGKL